jgi:hypothetical protein
MEATQQVSNEVTIHEELTPQGIVLTANYEGKLGRAMFTIEVDVVHVLRQLADKSENKVDDAIVDMVEHALD